MNAKFHWHYISVWSIVKYKVSNDQELVYQKHSLAIETKMGNDQNYNRHNAKRIYV